MKNLGTDQDFILTNSITEGIQPVDSIAKLNIMTEATNNPTSGVPQIMLSQTTTGAVKTWNGDRLTINYASGNKAGYFGISEVTGTYRNRINFEILGANNIFHTSVGGTYGNSFIYAEGNKLSKQTHNCNFIHSDYNVFNTSAADGINFINSTYNTLYYGSVDEIYASAKQISLYNSNYNTFQPVPETWTYTHQNGNKEVKGKKGCYLRNQTLIGSNYNYIKGRTISEDYPENKPNTTFINSCSGLYDFDEQHGSLTVIGNTLGYFNNNRNCNIIGIGEGLLQTDSNSDKILLGFYNQNTTDPNEILVVGDGRLNREYVKGLTSATKDWTTNLNKYRDVMSNISGTGSTAYNSNFYRHNIFTVNKDGYITISDYKVPSNSARYGYKGITAYVDGSTYEIPFNKVYNKINGNDSVDIMQETIDSYTKTIENKIESLPISKFETFTDPNTIITTDIQTSGFLNLAKTNNNASVKIINDSVLSTYSNNSLISISYQPNSINNPNRRIPAKIIWSYYPPIAAGEIGNKITASTLIYPYCTKQFILRKPNYPTDKNKDKPFSGLTLVDSDDTNSTVDYSIGSVSLTYRVSKIDGEVTKYYTGNKDTYSDSWSENVSTATIFSDTEKTKAESICSTACDATLEEVYS